MTCSAPTGEPLLGRVVRLDPVALTDVEGLFRIYHDPAAYEQGYRMHPPHARPEDTRQMVQSMLRARAENGTGRTAYTVRLVADGPLGAADTIVGSSSLGDIDLVREHAHLGWTFYGTPWWGTTVNPEAKLLLLGHAFETCGFGRVKIQTDAVNTRSRAAIDRLGAVFEGVTRRDVRRADGSWRDTAVYSVLVDEWPSVREGLLARLEGWS